MEASVLFFPIAIRLNLTNNSGILLLSSQDNKSVRQITYQAIDIIEEIPWRKWDETKITKRNVRTTLTWNIIKSNAILSIEGVWERTIDDCRYTSFRYPRFRTSAVVFRYHEEHQYPVHGRGRSFRADPLNCARSFTDSPPPFWLRGLQTKAFHGVSFRKYTGMLYVPRFTRFRYTRRFAGTQAPRITRVTWTENTLGSKSNNSR
jgi:hypothetical protein